MRVFQCTRCHSKQFGYWSDLTGKLEVTTGEMYRGEGENEVSAYCCFSCDKLVHHLTLSSRNALKMITMKAKDTLDEMVELGRTVARFDKSGAVTELLRRNDDELEDNIRLIEEGVPETKYHYGRYTAILGRIPPDLRDIQMVVMYIHGANPEGLIAARNILNGVSGR